MAELINYGDFFPTKSYEYLMVIGYLVLLVGFWYLLRGSRAETDRSRQPVASTVSTPWFRLYGKAFYHPGHTWAVPESDGSVRVGIDDFAAKFIGGVNALSLPGPGARVEQGEEGLKLIADGKEIPMVSPVDGEVVEVNDKVVRSPDLLVKDPYGGGWLFKVKAPNLRSNARNLLEGRYAVAWMEETVEALRDLMRTRPELGTVLQDGGAPVSGIAKVLANDSWDELARDFFRTRQ